MMLAKFDLKDLAAEMVEITIRRAVNEHYS